MAPNKFVKLIYKIGSGCIARRMKQILDTIIRSDQKGFLPGRYIVENTRIIYVLMQFTEERNIPGLLLMIDFEKGKKIEVY